MYEITMEFLDSQRETVLIYRGGQYPGCHWETNFGWFDEKGDFYPIYASGRKGCVCKEDIINKFDQYSAEKFIKREDIKKELVDAYHEMDVKFIMQWLIDEMYIYVDEVTQACEVCGEQCTFDEIQHSGARGNGGVGIIYTGYICSTCEQEQRQDICLLDDDGDLFYSLTYSDLRYKEPNTDLWDKLAPYLHGQWHKPVDKDQLELGLPLPPRYEWYIKPTDWRETREVDFMYEDTHIASVQFSERWD